MAEPLARQLNRLSDKIAAGDVVFFIGAGFSLESEYNTAGVLIARLLAQFEAIVVTARAKEQAGSELARLCADLHTGIVATFDLKTDELGEICGADLFKPNVDLLQQSYYPINDWMCSAFQSLLAYWSQLHAYEAAIHQRAGEALCRYLDALKAKKRRVNTWPIPRIAFERYRPLVETARSAGFDRVAAGKALFLDTMGFAEGGSMAGEPRADTLDEVIRSYGVRVRDRHSVLAWLALEGSLPVVLTTNYDLLLEGAYRIAGMEPLAPATTRVSGGDGPSSPARGGTWPQFNRRLRNFISIAGAPQFFSHGDGYQSAVILKIHGCVHDYRQARRNPATWRAVLPTMVFTFREIQNWREDSWSRDFVQTLLRTRTVVFAGYSGTDPVMHDTFRSVYEEMARYRAQTAADAQTHATETASRDAQAGSGGAAFFLDIAPKREFHGLEILRAASLAAGEFHPSLTTHPNLINFYGLGSAFPNVDELMLLTFHLAYRKLQQQALESELRRVAYQLFGEPSRNAEATAIVAAFDDLCEQERRRADLFTVDSAMPEPARTMRVAGIRRQFRQVIGWTVDFHRHLMREFAAADLLLRKPERASRVYAAMRWPWYAPLNEHPDWGAWAVVVELALRNRAGRWSGMPGAGGEAFGAVEPVSADRPGVLIQLRPGANVRPAPRVALTIELSELRRRSTSAAGALFRFTPPVVWSLRNYTVPWWVTGDKERPVATPSALTLWHWAAGLSEDRPAPEASPQDFFTDAIPKPKKKGAASR